MCGPSACQASSLGQGRYDVLLCTRSFKISCIHSFSSCSEVNSHQLPDASLVRGVREAQASSPTLFMLAPSAFAAHAVPRCRDSELDGHVDMAKTARSLLTGVRRKHAELAVQIVAEGVDDRGPVGRVPRFSPRSTPPWGLFRYVFSHTLDDDFLFRHVPATVLSLMFLGPGHQGQQATISRWRPGLRILLRLRGLGMPARVGSGPRRLSPRASHHRPPSPSAARRGVFGQQSAAPIPRCTAAGRPTGPHPRPGPHRRRGYRTYGSDEPAARVGSTCIPATARPSK